MRCPSTKTLTATFRDLSIKDANLIRKLAKAVDSADELEKLIDKSCPQTRDYARSCHGDPYTSQMWRTTMALHAIDVALGGYGVESLGPRSEYEYINFGDPYTTTLIYRRKTDSLSIGCWGDIAEKHPNWP